MEGEGRGQGLVVTDRGREGLRYYSDEESGREVGGPILI